MSSANPSLPATELCREIAPVVNQLAEQLPRKSRLNHDTCPQAVMCRWRIITPG